MARIEAPIGAGRLLATAFVLLMVALVNARLLWHGDWAWTLFWVLLPVVFLLLVATVGWLLAALGLVFFAGSVLALRAVVAGDAGWVLILLVPVLAFTVMLIVRVVRVMRAGGREPVGPDPKA